MNISSSTSSAYPSAGAGDSANAIKELENRKTELQADIQEVYQTDDEAKEKEQKLKALQQEMQKIEMQLQQLQRNESREEPEGNEPSQMPGDRLEISDKAMLLYKQAKEE
ncbi:FlxA-like family protein [Peribacillus muralis]|uniref:FlxA-like family protein n=1 Tax=Peribacillus muralis TaxID=264697 RepID=UPI003D07EF2D